MKSAEGTPFDEGKPAAESSNNVPDSQQIKQAKEVASPPPENNSLQGGPRAQLSASVKASPAVQSSPTKSSMKAPPKLAEESPSRPPLPPQKAKFQDSNAPFDLSKLLSQQMTADDTLRASNTRGTNHLKSDSIELSALFMPPQPNVGQINDIPTTQPTAPTKHQRGVSWDMNVVDKNKKPTTTVPPLPVLSGSGSADGPTVAEHIAGTAPTLPPRLSNMNLPTRPTSVIRNTSQGSATNMNLPTRPTSVIRNTSHGSATHSRKLSQESLTQSMRKFDLDEFLKEAPLELEAETLLLQTLEEREPMKTRLDSNSSSYANLPVDQGAHDFSLSPMSSNPSGDETDIKNGPAQNENIPPVSPSPSSYYTANTRGTISSTPSRRDLLDRATSKRDFDKTQKKNQGHRRNMTLEETLFGLTSALSSVNVDDNGSPVPVEIGGEGPMRARTDTAGSTDRLANTMNTLYKRVVKNDSPTPERAPKDDASSTSKKSDANANWKLLSANLKKYKKDEEMQHHETPIVEGEENDVEEGGTPGASSTGGNDNIDNGKCDNNKWKKGKRKSHLNPFRSLPYAEKIKEEWEVMHEFLRPRQSFIYIYCKYVILYLMLPALGIATILYHLADNPPTGRGKNIHSEYASASWWVIFICIRQVIVATLAKCTEVVFIDFLALQTRSVLRLFGPVVTLLFVQSKGWPFLLSSWGLYNFGLLAGSHPFARHWLFWQDWWGMFNEDNPSGSVTTSDAFFRTLTICTCVGVVVSIKRLAVGLYLGRQTFGNFAQPLSKVMNKMLLISEVSNLARDIEKVSWLREKRRSEPYKRKEEEEQVERPSCLSSERLSEIVASADAEDLGTGSATETPTVAKSTASLSCENMGNVIDIEDVDPYTGLLSSTQKSKVSELLGQWEEPDRGHADQEHVSVSAVLQFRRALAHMDTDFPFSASFGLADSRENCVASAQDVYQRLLLRHEDENYGVLKFDTFAVVALNRKGVLDTEKIKELIRLFRPDRNGSLTVLDFVRSVDAVYKELRLLRATVASSSKIDKALENIMNILFYAIMVTVILSQVGLDPLALFLSLSSVILAFAFMIGSASAKYFDGLLFILVQRPYGIGDRINVSNTEVDSGWGGSQGWIVDNVTLFTTTIVLAGTGERATISNGALAKSRIINGARSPKALLYVTLKISLDVPYQKIEIFKSAVEKFVKARPREWLSLAGFRVSGIYAEQNYVEYSIILQHRERWQNIVLLLDSRHTMHCFCLELSKKMKMRYRSPPLPVDLKMVGSGTVPDQFQFNNSSGEGHPAADNEEKSENHDNSLTLSPRSAGSDEWNSIAALFD